MFVSPVNSVSTTYPSAAVRPTGSVLPVERVRPSSKSEANTDPSVAERRDNPAAIVQISDEAKRLAAAAFSKSTAGENQAVSPSESNLSDEERQILKEMAARDREVRVHEQAHKSVGGQHAGAIHLDVQRGPDGQNYAVGGHVNIDASPVANDPSATLVKMQQVIRAALAPGDPSAADRSVAAKASSHQSEARQQLSEANSLDSDKSEFHTLLQGVERSQAGQAQVGA